MPLEFTIMGLYVYFKRLYDLRLLDLSIMGLASEVASKSHLTLDMFSYSGDQEWCSGPRTRSIYVPNVSRCCRKDEHRVASLTTQSVSSPIETFCGYTTKGYSGKRVQQKL